MRKGFTLVEVMIVVAIIGLLAAIAIPSFLNARKRSMFNTGVAQAGLVVPDWVNKLPFDGQIAWLDAKTNGLNRDTFSYMDATGNYIKWINTPDGERPADDPVIVSHKPSPEVVAKLNREHLIATGRAEVEMPEAPSMPSLLSTPSKTVLNIPGSFNGDIEVVLPGGKIVYTLSNSLLTIKGPMVKNVNIN